MSPKQSIHNPAAIIGDLVKLIAPELRPLETLHANPRNARLHDDRQITLLVANIRQFGFLIPILVDETGTILAGHARLEAARRLGLREVPVFRVEHLTPAQKRAFVLADNRIAELATWDRDLLRVEFEELSKLDLKFDIELTGFDTVAIDQLTAEGGLSAAPDPADDIPAAETNQPPVTRLRDLWLLGPHRILCADATDPLSYARLLGDDAAQMVFTDPPYNVPVDGHVSGKGRTRHPEFVMASGEMSPDEFRAFLSRSCMQIARHCAPGAIDFICMDWRHASDLQQAVAHIYGPPKNICVWVKDNGGMGTFYRSRHEFVLAFKVGTAPHINNFGLGERGRYRTNVWEYPGVNAFKRGRAAELAMHPTVKPAALVVDAIRDCSNRGGIVLDPFGGSGTTLIAAERTNRVARLMELDPRYVDVSVRRWQKFTGGRAVLTGDGRCFDEIEADRFQSDEIIDAPKRERVPDASPPAAPLIARGTRAARRARRTAR